MLLYKKLLLLTFGTTLVHWTPSHKWKYEWNMKISYNNDLLGYELDINDSVSLKAVKVNLLATLSFSACLWRQ